MTDRPARGFPVPVVCVDGPMAGARTTVAAGDTSLVMYDPAGAAYRYRVDGPLSEFPGHTLAAYYVESSGEG